MNLQELVRPNIWSLKPYSSARDEFKGEASVYLDANENPYNAPYNRYPDPLQWVVKEQIEKVKGASRENILLGNGSDEPIDLVFRAFCEPGVENVVASLGTSLTPQQVELLGRFTREVVVSYDPDSAGLAATQRSLDLFLEGDFRVKVLRLPAGQDPDVFVRSAGPEEYQKRAQESVPYLEFVLETAIQSQGTLDDPKKKVQAMNVVLPYLAKLPSAVERSDYVFQFARRLGIEDQQLLAETRRAAQQKKVRLSEESVTSALSMKFAEKRLLQLLLGRADLQQEVLPLCSRQDFEGLAAEKIFLNIHKLDE